MSFQKYPTLTSPVMVNGVRLRNRAIVGPCGPTFPGNGELWPNDRFLAAYAKKAKYAAIVTCKGSGSASRTPREFKREGFLDIRDLGAQNGFSALADAVHFYGARAHIAILPDAELVGDFDAGSSVAFETLRAGEDTNHMSGEASEGQMASRELLEKVADRYVEEAVLAKECGYDGAYIHMAYRLFLPARFLSPITNNRTDEFGGSIENRARFPLMILERIKKACGEDFLIDCSVTAEETGGTTIEDTIKFAKLAEGKIDFLQIRGNHVNDSSLTNFFPVEFQHLDAAEQVAQALHDSDCRVQVSLTGGVANIDHVEQLLRERRVDFVHLARSIVADPEWIKKAYEGRSEDVVPCLRCNKCHNSAPRKWTNICSVNPEAGLEQCVGRMITQPDPAGKRVAVIGSGTAGMEAAIVSADRGYTVTLFEKEDRLGGALNYASVPDFKYTIRDFRDYLIRQVNKRNIEVRLNTKATPELLEAEGFDLIYAALGSEPVIPQIPGYDQPHVVTSLDALEDHTQLGQHVVIVGGGEIGTEIGIYLAREGHDVFVIEMQDKLAPECPPLHYRGDLQEAWEREERFRFVVDAAVTRIGKDTVAYTDGNGMEHTISAESVVMSAGMRPLFEEASAFAGAAPHYELIGDCIQLGNIQTAMRSAYGRACNN